MPCFLRFSHEMEKALGCIKVKIQVNFHPAGMGMWRNRVPYTSFFQDSQAHDQLTTMDTIPVDILVNSSFVGCSSVTQCYGRSLLFSKLLCRICVMGRCRKQIILGRVFFISRAERYFLGALSNIQTFKLFQPVFFSINHNLTFATNVDYPQFPSLPTLFRPQLCMIGQVN